MSNSAPSADSRTAPSSTVRKDDGPVKRLLDTLKRPFQRAPKKSKKKGNPNIYPLY